MTEIKIWAHNQQWWLAQLGLILEVNHHYSMRQTQESEMYFTLYVTHTSRTYDRVRIFKGKPVNREQLTAILQQQVHSIIRNIRMRYEGQPHGYKVDVPEIEKESV